MVKPLGMYMENAVRPSMARRREVLLLSVSVCQISALHGARRKKRTLSVSGASTPAARFRSNVNHVVVVVEI